jgi:hypothetical protein
MKLKDSTYDFLKWLAIYFIPGLTTLIGVIGVALKWEPTAIATTISGALGAFIAACIGMSCREYEKEKSEKYDGGVDE